MWLKKSIICIFFTQSGKIYTWQTTFTQTPSVVPVTNMRYVTKWSQSNHQVVTKWSPCGHQVVTMWSPSGHHVDNEWSPSGHQMVTKWSPSGHEVDTKWSPSGWQVVTKWSLGGNVIADKKSPSIVCYQEFPAKIFLKTTFNLMNIQSNHKPQHQHWHDTTALLWYLVRRFLCRYHRIGLDQSVQCLLQARVESLLWGGRCTYHGYHNQGQSRPTRLFWMIDRCYWDFIDVTLAKDHGVPNLTTVHWW